MIRKKRTKGIFIFLNVKNGEASANLYLKCDVTLVTHVFEKLIKVSINEFDINPLSSVSLFG